MSFLRRRSRQDPPNLNPGYGYSNPNGNAAAAGGSHPYQHQQNAYAQQPPPLQHNNHYGHPPPPPPPRAPGPPPGADPRLWQFFTSVDTDGSGAIDVRELQRALINANWSTFDLDTVKMLMNIFDTDRSGNIGFNEFAGLYKYIEDWQAVFRHWDADHSGTIEERELTGALNGFGYNLSPQLVKLVVAKYSSVPISGHGGPPPAITFDRFVRACVVVKELTEAFRKVDRDNDGWIQISYDQFMGIFLHAP